MGSEWPNRKILWGKYFFLSSILQKKIIYISQQKEIYIFILLHNKNQNFIIRIKNLSHEYKQIWNSSTQISYIAHWHVQTFYPIPVALIVHLGWLIIAHFDSDCPIAKYAFARWRRRPTWSRWILLRI